MVRLTETLQQGSLHNILKQFHNSRDLADFAAGSMSGRILISGNLYVSS